MPQKVLQSTQLNHRERAHLD